MPPLSSRGASGCPAPPEAAAVELDVDRFARDVQAQLHAQGVPERAVGEKAYLKSDLEFYGATVPQIRRTVKAFRARHARPRPRRPDRLGRKRSGNVRCTNAGSAADRVARVCTATGSEASDSVVIERMLRQSRTWALVDDLSASVMGPLVERCPELGATLDRWAARRRFLAPPVRPARAAPGSAAR